MTDPLVHDYDTCPCCGSELISGGNFETDFSVAWRTVTCSDCGSHWSDDYKFAGISDIVNKYVSTPKREGS